MAPNQSIYDVHPGMAMMEAIIRNLKARSGRTLDEWIQLLKSDGPKEEKQQRQWLKNEYDLGMSTVGIIVDRAAGRGHMNSDEYLKRAPEYVDAMFSGPAADLRPIYNSVVAEARKLGKDVRICPAQTIVPLYRNHVFAQIKPATQTRIDLGLALGDLKAPKRLVDTGGLAKKDRITHRIELRSVAEIDSEVKKWLKAAYERDKRAG